MHILGVTQRPVEAPSSPFGGARSPDSVPIPIFQTVSEEVFSEIRLGAGLEAERSKGLGGGSS